MTRQKKRRRAVWIVLIIFVVIVGAIAAIGRLLLNQRAENMTSIRTLTVGTGTIEKTVSGSGHLAAETEILEIEVLDGLSVDDILAEEGDTIKAGDLLAVFNEDDLLAAVRSAQSELDDLDASLERLKGKQESQYVSALVSGRIKAINAGEGEEITTVMANHGALMILSVDGLMKTSFKPVVTGGLAAGDEVRVILSDQTEIDGIIQSISAHDCVITFPDRYPAIGEATAVLMTDGTAIGQGKAEINQPLAISGTSGTVESILCDMDQAVKKGTRLIKLTEAEASWTFQDLYRQRIETAERLSTLMRYIENGGLVSEAAGIIRLISIAEDQETGSASYTAATSGSVGSGSSSALSVETSRIYHLYVDIDELDITMLSIGQQVKVTIGALPDPALEGVIAEIADQGDAGSGSTTFQVSVSLPFRADMKDGLSATAVIVAERRENIVRLPLEALQEIGDEQFVYVGKAVSAARPGEKRTVTIGISDGLYVEITGGLTAGETVNYLYDDGTSSLFPFGGRFAERTAGQSNPAVNE